VTLLNGSSVNLGNAVNHTFQWNMPSGQAVVADFNSATASSTLYLQMHITENSSQVFYAQLDSVFGHEFCIVSTTTTSPNCPANATVVNRTLGTITLSNTRFVDTSSGTVIHATGQLNFTPF